MFCLKNRLFELKITKKSKKKAKSTFLKSIFWHEGVKIRQSRGLVFFSEGFKDFKNQKKSSKIDKKLNRVPHP